MNLGDLPTPSLVLDRRRMERNTQRMARRATKAGVRLRPHMKTAKSADVARIATADHSGAVTVSTLAEAEYFAKHGFTDITYAVCIIPQRLDRVAALQGHGADIKLITDDANVARAAAERARALDTRFKLLVELDSGEHRTGVPADATSEILGVARAIHEAAELSLEGVLTHAGHSYDCSTIEEVRAVAEEERRAAINAAELLRGADLPCPTVSIGSTPTCVHAESFEGITEIRPGVYVFFDLAQLTRASCHREHLALSVLATVIGHQKRHRRLIVDAGALALSKDTSAQPFLPDAGYGWILDASTCERIGDLRVSHLDQEHGYVDGTEMDLDALPIGSRVRILPNHACLTAAHYDQYAVVDGDDQIVATWDRCRGW